MHAFHAFDRIYKRIGYRVYCLIILTIFAIIMAAMIYDANCRQRSRAGEARAAYRKLMVERCIKRYYRGSGTNDVSINGSLMRVHL